MSSVYFDIRNPFAPGSSEETRMSVAMRVTAVVVGLLGIGLGIVGLVYYASLFGIIGVGLGSSLIISALFIGQYNRTRLTYTREVNHEIPISDRDTNSVESTNLISINHEKVRPLNEILLNPQTPVPQLNFVSSTNQNQDRNEFWIQGRQSQTSSCGSKIYKINQDGLLKIRDLESSLETTYQFTVLGHSVLYQNKLAVYQSYRLRYFYIFDLNTLESQRFELNEGERWSNPVFINAELFMASTNGSSKETCNPRWIHQLTSQSPCYRYNGPAVQDTLDTQFITYREVDTNLRLAIHNRESNTSCSIEIVRSEKTVVRSPEDPYTERKKNAIILTPHNVVIGLNSAAVKESCIEVWSLNGALQLSMPFEQRIVSLHKLQGPNYCIVFGLGCLVNEIQVFNSETYKLTSLPASLKDSSPNSRRSDNIITYGSLLAFRKGTQLFIYNLQNPDAPVQTCVDIKSYWVSGSQLSLNDKQLFITRPGAEISKSHIWRLVSQTSAPKEGEIPIL